MKKLVFAVAGYNLAETCRMIEIAREARKHFEIIIASYGGGFEELIEKEGFSLRRMEPRLSEKKRRRLRKVLSGQSLNTLGYFSAKELGRRVPVEIAKTSMASLYQLDDLKKCEGDIFENFKKFNIAMFERTTRDGTWLMENYEDETDKLTIKITTCANVELFSELGVPELGKFGCDHDLAGYPIIEDDVDCEFRRMCTIAKGDDCCIFEFYRKGTAPDNAHLNK